MSPHPSAPSPSSSNPTTNPTTTRIGYFLWSGAGFFLQIGIPRLLLYPLATAAIGAEQFGLFLTALSMVSLMGLVPSGAMSSSILRIIADYSATQRSTCYRLALCLNGMVVSAIIAFAIIAGGIIWPSQENSNPLLMAVAAVLLLSLWSENQFVVARVPLRYQRRFRTATLQTLAQSAAATLLGLTGALTQGAIGLAIGICIGNTIAYLGVRTHLPTALVPPPPALTRRILSLWLTFSIGGVLAIAGVHINRIVLGASGPYSDVTTLFSATAIISIFLSPAQVIGSTIFSLISRNQTFQTGSGKVGIMLFTLCAGLVAGTTLGTWIIGPWLLHFFFPEVAPTATGLLGILIICVPFSAAQALLTPFFVKFAPRRLLLGSYAISTSLFILSSLLLVPEYHANGAAASYVIGMIAQALLIAISLFFSTTQTNTENGHTTS